MPNSMKNTFYNTDYSTFTNSDPITVTYGTELITVDFMKIEFSSNVYTANFAGYAKGLVDIKGA